MKSAWAELHALARAPAKSAPGTTIQKNGALEVARRSPTRCR